MNTKRQIIENMCLTFRHDYNLVISEDDKMYTLSSGMTERERDGLRRDMSQIFEHNFETIYDSYRNLVEGRTVPIPTSEAHAQAMLLVAVNYLKNNG